jgi:hypothetical protein
MLRPHALLFAGFREILRQIRQGVREILRRLLQRHPVRC